MPTELWELLIPIGSFQAKKKHYDVELETLEKTQKQTIEKMETDHHIKLKEETKRIKAAQERDHHKFQDQMKHKKKEVMQSLHLLSSNHKSSQIRTGCQCVCLSLRFLIWNVPVGETVCGQAAQESA